MLRKSRRPLRHDCYRDAVDVYAEMRADGHRLDIKHVAVFIDDEPFGVTRSFIDAVHAGAEAIHEAAREDADAGEWIDHKRAERIMLNVI